jgi:hypothetical protein
MDGAGHGALFVLFGFAHVEEREVVEPRGDVVRVNLRDLGLGSIQ